MVRMETSARIIAMTNNDCKYHEDGNRDDYCTLSMITDFIFNINIIVSS